MSNELSSMNYELCKEMRNALFLLRIAQNWRNDFSFLRG